jgi:hypothetical protein
MVKDDIAGGAASSPPMQFAVDAWLHSKLLLLAVILASPGTR